MGLRMWRLTLIALVLTSPLFADVPNAHFEAWDKILKEAVDPVNGKVNYPKLAELKPDLDKFLDGHKKINPESLSDSEKKAVYINLYNAGMMSHILRYAAEEKVDVKSDAF